MKLFIHSFAFKTVTFGQALGQDNHLSSFRSQRPNSWLSLNREFPNIRSFRT